MQILITAKEAKIILGSFASRLHRLVKSGYIIKIDNKYDKHSVETFTTPYECDIRNIEDYKIWFKNNMINIAGKIDATKTTNNTNFNIKFINYINRIDLFIIQELHNRSISEKYFCLINNINVVVKCICCDNDVNFNVNTHKYLETCSSYCANKLNYGVRHKHIKPYIEMKKYNIYGLNGYQEVGLKSIQTKLNTINNEGLSILQVSLLKTKQTKLNIINNEGLNGYQLQGLKSRHTKLNTINADGLNIFQVVGKLAQESKSIEKGNHQSSKKVLDISIPKMLKTKVERGYIHGLDKDDYYLYRNIVDFYTGKVWCKYYDYINPNGLKRGKDYHLDHIYSVMSGFRNNIAPWIISHPCNLQIIESKANISKSSKCDIELENLISNITDFDDDYSLKGYKYGDNC